MNSTNPVVTLRAQAEEFDFGKLRAGKDNAEANSGEQMYKDINRMDFVINGKSIDQTLTSALMEGAKQREFDKIWSEYCENDNTPDHKKTDQYEKEFERFYNLGKEYAHLLPKEEARNYRPFAKEVFKEMFKYAEAKVPSDSILEELITNCNQAGYEGTLFTDVLFQAFRQSEFTLLSPQKTIVIDCTDPNHVKVKSEMAVPTVKSDNPEEEVCQINSSLEFTLAFQDEKNDVTYKDGKLLLTAPRELKNYKIDGKNLFDIIKEYFQKFCEKLGFKFEAEIEHSLGNPLEVNSHLENMEPPIHSNEHGNTPGN
ncbi:hypothetical protein NMD99_03985 [Wolbachia endosymbiont of Listronotus oregonensis]|uniref:hypothetical protein n=1 Tax=unclassified Wolbachia TaxID=2640676 RepID=UPI0022274E0D|nr:MULTISPECIES: hypothetical protein [unclassified Wolbachia]WMT85139.1 hypothetical protein NMD99_03985 [Wolbachia endosymbiont of Listronotus oregonensis]